nr:transcriptional repressor [Desulfobulbaceae bacterium]
MVTATEAFKTFLKNKNLQQTAQRDLIVEEFVKAGRHVSVEELYSLVRKKEASIGQVTIFRTLKLLAEAKIAKPVNFGDKIVRYELKYGTQHHDHLVCTQCGAVIEVLDPKLERIQEQLCKKYKFAPSRHRLEIFGRCQDCQ